MKNSKQKLIPFTEELEKAIEKDAGRCRRSFVRQVEAVLMTYYNIADVEVDRTPLEILGELNATSKKKTPVVEITSKKSKKKKAG